MLYSQLKQIDSHFNLNTFFSYRNFLYVTDAAEAFISILHQGFAGINVEHSLILCYVSLGKIG
jgi:hypothetical protein